MDGKNFRYDEVTLEKLRLGIHQVVSPWLLDAEVRAMESIISDQIEIAVRGAVWSEKVPDVLTYKWPADWWQAFKDRWFPAWALARWPVEWEAHTVDFKIIYPGFRASVPHEEFRIRAFVDGTDYGG